MARVSYVPFDQDYATLFAFCGISLPTTDFGGKQGWDAELFSAAAIEAKEYLDNHWDDDQAETFETWFDKLDNYGVYYWSTESPTYG